MGVQDYLKQTDAHFDPESCLVWSIVHTPGYHTRIPNGRKVRQTRGAMNYALALLESGEAWRVQRAFAVIDAIAALQITDPLAQHYGIWGWFAEEPPEQMNPADWNWADFIGVRLLQALEQHGEKLPDATREKIRTALRHAALSIFRRNVLANYTNIAIMGGVLTAAVGELLNLPFLLDYGRRRLASVKELTERVGGFGEYNSPTYTRIALEEAERGLLLIRDPQTRALCEWLCTLAWATIAERFHPGTGQMAGPNSRAYSDWLKPGFCRYLREQTGAPIHPRPSAEKGVDFTSEELYDQVPPVPCPPAIAERFHRLPRDPHVLVTRFGQNEQFGDIIGTTWFTEDACLGSVSRGFSWDQQRPFLGYWRTPEDPAVVLRTRMLRSVENFCAGEIRSVQDGPRTLSSWSLFFDIGPFHPHFDKPADNKFELRDWRFRLTLQGRGVRTERLDATRFALSAGSRRAVVHTMPARCGTTPLAWGCGQEGDTAYVEVVLHAGAVKTFDFSTLPLELSYGVELLHAGEAPATGLPRAENQSDGKRQLRWNGLELLAPTRPRAFAW